MSWRCGAILGEIAEAGYDGRVVNGMDMDVFDLERVRAR